MQTYDEKQVQAFLKAAEKGHTCATLLLRAGVNPKIVSERLGHKSVAFTLDVCSHVLPTMQQGAARELDRIYATK